jgi:hypothetical protein
MEFSLCSDLYVKVPRDFAAEMSEAINKRNLDRAANPDNYVWSDNCAEDFDVIEPFNDNPLYCWMRPVWNFYEQACVSGEQEEIYCKSTCRFGWGLEFVGTPIDFVLYFAPYMLKVNAPLMIEDGECASDVR